MSKQQTASDNQLSAQRKIINEFKISWDPIQLKVDTDTDELVVSGPLHRLEFKVPSNLIVGE